MAVKVRSQERVSFLSDVLVGAIESGSYGSWMDVREYHVPAGKEAEWFAVIVDEGDGGTEELRVDLDVIARGLAVIKNSELRAVDGNADELALHNKETGQRLYMSPGMKRNIGITDRTNADQGDMDVCDYLAVVECALFGAVKYG